MQETWVQSLGGEDALKKGKATHSSILARRTPWSIPLGCRVAHDWQTFTFFTTSATWEALTSYYCCVTSVMSNCVWPHRRQPTRLPRPWDSPGKNSGVGCHFLLQCMKMKSESKVAQSCLTLSDPMDCSPPGSSIHGIFQTRVLEWGAIAFSYFILGSD